MNGVTSAAKDLGKRVIHPMYLFNRCSLRKCGYCVKELLRCSVVNWITSIVMVIWCHPQKGGGGGTSLAVGGLPMNNNSLIRARGIDEPIHIVPLI